MFFFDSKEFNEVKRKYYDPKNPITKLAYKSKKSAVRFHLGFIEDNKDPDKMCRVKVRFPQWGDNIISDWVSLIKPFGGTDMGFGFIPEIDEQVICCFINDNSSKPIVLGSIYNANAKPKIDNNKENNLKTLISKSGSKIELHEKDGEEKIVVKMKDEKLMLIIDKEEGISIINDDGDINIKCKKLIINPEEISPEDTAFFKMTKSLAIECQNDNLTFEATKNIKLNATQDVVIKGNKVKLNGELVTASSQIVAKKDDKVIGVDIHDVWMTIGSSKQKVPLPHPYAGELRDLLSQDVEIKGKQVAVKGSKSKYDKPGHIAQGEGFVKQPTNEGEVTSGTISTVKVNNKEIAVIGSMVKTCNDPIDQEMCSVIPGS